MHQHTKHIFIQVSLLSLVILGVFQVGSYAIAKQGEEKSVHYNELTYPSAGNQNISQVGVALGTGIGVRFDTETYNETTFYGEVGELGDTDETSRAIRESMLRENMVIIQEYLSLAKTNVLQVLETSSDRRTTLNTLISQLELRYRNAAISMINLQNQKTLLLTNIEKIQTEIEGLKSKMSTDFGENNSNAVLEDVDTYIELRHIATSNFTDVVLINQFLTQYDFLNKYNKNLLDTLINNKEALINKSFVVIPDSGDEFLKEFQLLYEEAEFKALNQEQ